MIATGIERPAPAGEDGVGPGCAWNSTATGGGVGDDRECPGIVPAKVPPTHHTRRNSGCDAVSQKQQFVTAGANLALARYNDGNVQNSSPHSNTKGVLSIMDELPFQVPAKGVG